MSDTIKDLGDLFGKMSSAKQVLSDIKVVGEAGAGMAKVEMNGRQSVKKVTLDPELITENQTPAESVAIISELVTAAFNDALKKVEKESQAQLMKFASSELFSGKKKDSSDE